MTPRPLLSPGEALALSFRPVQASAVHLPTVDAFVFCLEIPQNIVLHPFLVLPDRFPDEPPPPRLLALLFLVFPPGLTFLRIAVAAAVFHSPGFTEDFTRVPLYIIIIGHTTIFTNT